MIARRRHPKKEIAEALDDAQECGFDVEEIHRAHRWGRVICPGCGEDWRVSSTPRNPWAIGREITRFVKKHSVHVRKEDR